MIFKGMNSVKRYPKMLEVIDDGSKPPKLGTYTPPLPYLAGKSKAINKIISGGQTGADRAALDFAIAHNIPHGGWCPKGRRAEDGVISSRYQLNEMATGDYLKRTKQNITDSDATLILNCGELDGGSLRTMQFAQQLNKPFMIAQLDRDDLENQIKEASNWIHTICGSLNVAGPRESKRPSVYRLSYDFLTRLFESG